MKKVIKLQGLDCAHCAAKMEREIQKLPGVASASVNFVAEKLTVEVDDAALDAVCKGILKIVKRIEPDCEPVF